MSGEISRTSEKDRHAETDDSPADAPDLETILDLLSHGRRRRSIRQLVDRGDPIHVDDLSGTLAAAEVGSTTDVTGVDRLSVRRSLVHAHLPVLANAGIAEYDDGTELVAAGPSTDHVRNLLGENVP